MEQVLNICCALGHGTEDQNSGGSEHLLVFVRDRKTLKEVCLALPQLLEEGMIFSVISAGALMTWEYGNARRMRDRRRWDASMVWLLLEGRSEAPSTLAFPTVAAATAVSTQVLSPGFFNQNRMDAIRSS